MVAAVSYLNTAPLIWGFEYGPLAGEVVLQLALPSECADYVRQGAADIGILPVIEIERQGLAWLPSVGIACRGPVRSILLIARKPLSAVKLLAADSGSRTSIELARILLAERFGATPRLISMRADLDAMLASADAALIIGDPALRLDVGRLAGRYEVLDLGEEWVRHTSLPMVFALWAGRPGRIQDRHDELFRRSYDYGRRRLEEIIERECPPRRIDEDLARRYLSWHIVFELGARDLEGMRAYLRLARSLATLKENAKVAL